MARRGVQWVFELLDKATNPARRITKALEGVRAAGQQGYRGAMMYGTSLARSLNLPIRYANTLATTLRAVGHASRTLDTARMRAQQLGITLSRIRGTVFNLPNLIITGAIGMAGKGFTDQMGFIEQQRIALATLMQDPIRGDAVLEWSIKFADITPYETVDVLGAVRNVLAMGFNTRQIEPLVTTLGDTASALSLGPSGLNDLIMVFGQIKAAGNLMTQDVYQLTNRGIAAFDILAQGLGTNVAGVKKMLEQGEINSERALSILHDALTDRYGGGMAKQSRSLFGLVSTLKGRVTSFASAAENAGGLDPLKRLVGNLVTATDTNSAVGQMLVSRVSGAVRSVGEATFGNLADLFEPSRVEATVERMLGSLEALGSWWQQNSPGIIAQARAFGTGIGDGFRLLARAWEATAGLRASLTNIGGGLFGQGTAQASVTGGGAQLIGTLMTLLLTFKLLNILTLGAAGSLIRFGISSIGAAGKLAGLGGHILKLGRLLLLAGGPWAWIARVAILAAVLIWQNWDKIGPFLQGLWEGITDTAAAAWERIVKAGTNTVDWFRMLPGRITSALSGLWDRVVLNTSSAWQWIIDQVYAAWDWLRSVPSNLQAWFAGLWEGVKAHTSEVWDSVEGRVNESPRVFRRQEGLSQAAT